MAIGWRLAVAMPRTIDGNGPEAAAYRLKHRGSEILQRAKRAVNEDDRLAPAFFHYMQLQLSDLQKLPDRRKGDLGPAHQLYADPGQRAQR